MTPKPSTPLVDLRDVSRTYAIGDVEVRALSGVSLQLFEAEMVAIMGASGSGKSTLMNIIGCLDRPTAGTYLLRGEDVSRLSRAERARLRSRRLGFVFQGFHLLSRTSALANVELPLIYADIGRRERRRRAREALERVGLGDRLDHTASQLSGGQQQRVAIARALVTRPEIVLADEPTGNLDSHTALEIMRILRVLVDAGILVVVVTHEADIAAYAERVVTLFDGALSGDRRQSPRTFERPLEVPA